MKYVYVNSKRMEYVKEQLNALAYQGNESLTNNDVLVLPFINAKLNKELMNLNELKNITIFCPFFNAELDGSNTIYAYMEDEQLISDNAYLTAIGLFVYVNTLPIRKDDVIDVIGDGRCGRAIYELFKKVKIPVRLISRRTSKDVLLLSDYQQMNKGKLIVNTAIKNVSLGEHMETCESMIDISSDHVMEAYEDIQVLYPGSLPERYTPSASAKLICDYIGRYV